MAKKTKAVRTFECLDCSDGGHPADTGITGRGTAGAVVCAGSDWLQHIGVYGWPIPAQDAILTSLVTGQPLLFVSRHGCAKTFVAETLARLLGLSFTALDASKSNWEDLIGFVNPAGLSQGHVDYVPSPLSLWDKEFILIDEISRAKPQTANSYLELIRSHTLQGRKLPALRHVFAAMNPADGDHYIGASMLDSAMLSRFVFVVEVPSLSDISEDSFLDILLAANDPMNAPLIRRKSDKAAEPDLVSTIDEARQKASGVDRKEREAWALYLRALKNAIVAQDRRAAELLDMRTMNAVTEAIIARRALCSEGDTEESGFPAIGHLIAQCFGLLRLQNGSLKPFPFESAHLVAVEAAFGIGLHAKRAYSDSRLRHLPLSMIPDELPDMLLDVADGGKAMVGRRLVSALKHPTTPEEAGHALGCLCRLLCILPTQSEPSALRHLAEQLEEVYLTEHCVAVCDIVQALGIDPDALEDDPCLRICLTYVAAREFSGGNGHPGSLSFGGIRQFITFYRQVKADAARFTRELTQMAETLAADLKRGKERDGRLMEHGTFATVALPRSEDRVAGNGVIDEDDMVPF